MTHSSSQNLTVINADFKPASCDVQKATCTYSKSIQWFRKKKLSRFHHKVHLPSVVKVHSLKWRKCMKT